MLVVPHRENAKMADHKDYGLKGVGPDVQLGKGGSRLKENGGTVEFKDSTDTTYVRLSAADPVNDQDVVTKSYLSNYTTTTANKLELPEDGAHGGAVDTWIVGTTTYSTAIDDLNEVLGRLVPDAPPNLSSFSISTTGGNNELLASGATDNTGGSIPSAGSTVYTIFGDYFVSTYANGGSGATGADVEGDTGNLFADGDSGTLTAYINGVDEGSVTLSTADDVGQYGALDIDSDVDYPADTPEFYKALKARINKTSLVSVGYNNAYLSHSETGSTNTIGWVYDNVAATPTVSSQSYSLNTSTGSYSSGVKHLTDNDTINVSASVADLVGQTYTTSKVVEFTTYPNCGYKSLTLTDLGVTLPASANLTTQNASSTISITGTVFDQCNVRVQAWNPRGNTSVSTISGDPLLVKTSNYSGNKVYEDRVAASSATGYRYYLGSGFTGDTPSGTLVAPTSSNWNSTQDLSASGYTHEAVVVAGDLKHDTTNYTIGFIPVSTVDYSLKDASQYFTFVFNQATLSSFSIDITGTYSGLWVALPGVSDNSEISPNALGGNWWDAFALYNGSGVPGRTGDTSAGCATGSVASGSSGTVNITFGTQSSSNSTNNAVIVRIKLTAGQSITAMYVTNTP